MKTSTGLRSAAVAAGILTSFVLAPPSAQAPALAMLGKLDRGQWEVRFRDGSDARRLCLQTGRELIQLKHSAPGCSHYVVEDGAAVVTVQYTCKGNGYGRTSLRRETSSLVQVDSQGIAGGLPFQFTAEARRVGTCR
ncbi:MAG: DUF3617 domain-containing protein [Tsuneonella sp.]